MKKNLIKVFTFLGIVGLLGVFVKYSSRTFAGNSGTIDISSIINTGCIEFSTPDGTGRQCDDVKIYYAEDVYPVLKQQKTEDMDEFTREDIYVNYGDYIQYKVDFINQGEETIIKAVVKDYLPNCVTFVTGSIHGVSNYSFNSNNTSVWFNNFSLEPGQSGYMLITGKIATGTNCSNVSTYLNTGSFKSTNPNGSELFSTVVARIGSGWLSQVIFTKTGNWNTWHPGETGLEFTLTLRNDSDRTITDIVFRDIWPDDDCIIYSGYQGTHFTKSGSDLVWNYGQNLSPNNSATLKIYAYISNNQSCIGDYINTGKAIFNGGEKEGYYPFIVVSGGPTSDQIKIEKTVSKTYVKSGDEITYTIKYWNTSSERLESYVIEDIWPSELQYNRAKFGGNIITPAINGNVYKWIAPGQLPALPPNNANNPYQIIINATVLGR